MPLRENPKQKDSLKRLLLKILAETEVGSAEEQPARDRLMHVLTVRSRPDLDSSKPDRGFFCGPPYGRNVVLIGFFQA